MKKDKIKNSYLHSLLLIIKRNSDLSFLVDMGLNYFQISNLMLEALKEGLIKDVDNKLIITKLGNKRLEDLINNFERSILPIEDINPRYRYSIYVPSKKIKL